MVVVEMEVVVGMIVKWNDLAAAAEKQEAEGGGGHSHADRKMQRSHAFSPGG